MTTYDGKTINLDTSDFKGMIDLMDIADEFTSMQFGKNAEGETVAISVNHDNITVETFQDNGWTLETIFYRDGTVEEIPHRGAR